MSEYAKYAIKVDQLSGYITGVEDLRAGNYRVTDRVSFKTAKRPNWLHRTMARLLLGWKWEPDGE